MMGERKEGKGYPGRQRKERKQGGEEKRMMAMTAATNSEPGVHHPIDSCRLNDNIL
jgi:hypothetical protein